MIHNDDWYLYREEKTIGPISNQTLEAMLKSGEIDARQVIWQETPERKLYVRAERVLANPAGTQHSDF